MSARGSVLVPRRQCETCRADFYAPPVLVRRGGGRFCSVPCRARWQGSLGRDLVKIECARCGRDFEVPPSHAVHRKNCSKSCGPTESLEVTRIPPQMIGRKRSIRCATCGAIYLVQPGSKSRFCSRACFGMNRSQNPTNTSPRGQGGRRPDLWNLYFRSRWEANWARYLRWLVELGEIWGWQFEPDTFRFPVKRGSVFYTPDFKVVNRDGSVEYHEVKGWFDQVSRTKLNRMRIHHPQVKVVLIDKTQYTAVARKVRGLIPGWEIQEKHRW